MNMKAIIYPIVALIFLYLTACSPTYLPQMHNTPLFQTKGELQFNGAASITGGQLSAGYAVTDKIGLIGGTQVAQSPDLPVHRSGYLGAGTFLPIGDVGVAEFYGGLGGGIGDDIPYQQYFVQGNIGVQGKIFSAALSYKQQFVRYRDIGTGIYGEPSLLLRIGRDPLKLFIQGGLSLPYNELDDTLGLPFMLALGLNVRITPRQKNPVPSN